MVICHRDIRRIHAYCSQSTQDKLTMAYSNITDVSELCTRNLRENKSDVRRQATSQPAVSGFDSHVIIRNVSDYNSDSKFKHGAVIP
jgi:hypothetical protein